MVCGKVRDELETGLDEGAKGEGSWALVVYACIMEKIPGFTEVIVLEEISILRSAHKY